MKPIPARRLRGALRCIWLRAPPLLAAQPINRESKYQMEIPLQAGVCWLAPPDLARVAPCSAPSRPLRAASGGGLRPALTAPARAALRTQKPRRGDIRPHPTNGEPFK